MHLRQLGVLEPPELGNPPQAEPDCEADLTCDFPLDLNAAPANSVPAAVANAFYWTNTVHDIQYKYGFDEAAGNFQVDNFGRGGIGGDHVAVEIQDFRGDRIVEQGQPLVLPDPERDPQCEFRFLTGTHVLVEDQGTQRIATQPRLPGVGVSPTPAARWLDLQR